MDNNELLVKFADILDQKLETVLDQKLETVLDQKLETILDRKRNLKLKNESEKIKKSGTRFLDRKNIQNENFNW